MNEIITLFAKNTTTTGGTTPGAATTPGGIDPVAGTQDLTQNVTNIINGIIAVLGLVCVVVMIVGGVNYMTSGGDTGKVKKGKDTILYGLIGLIICVLAFAIVNFVIKNIIG